MPKIICTLPNASELINGVAFVSHAKGMISAEVDDTTAEAFLAIPGYELHQAVKPQAPIVDDAAAAELAALRQRAKELAVKIDNRWGIDRLKTEIADAERAAGATKPPEQQEQPEQGAQQEQGASQA